MPSPATRAPKGTTLPKTRAAVPAWLTVAYGVQFADGEPDLPGWLAIAARAESIIEKPSVARREHIRILREHAGSEKCPGNPLLYLASERSVFHSAPRAVDVMGGGICGVGESESGGQ